MTKTVRTRVKIHDREFGGMTAKLGSREVGVRSLPSPTTFPVRGFTAGMRHGRGTGLSPPQRSWLTGGLTAGSASESVWGGDGRDLTPIL